MTRFLAAVFGLLFLGPLLPGIVAAQSGPGLGADGEVGATLSARTGVTWLGSRILPIGALAATLRLSERLEVGGEAVIGLTAIRLSPTGSPDRSELTTGYGGLLLRWRPAGDAPGIRWGGSLQLGAGTARIRSPLSRAAIVTENYLLLEPRIGALLQQDRRIRFSGQAGYRITTGANGLPGIRVSELRGPSFTLGAQLVFDPTFRE